MLKEAKGVHGDLEKKFQWNLEIIGRENFSLP